MIKPEANLKQVPSSIKIFGRILKLNRENFMLLYVRSHHNEGIAQSSEAVQNLNVGLLYTR